MPKGSMPLAANLILYAQSRQFGWGKPAVKLKTVAAPAATAKPHQQKPQEMWQHPAICIGPATA